MENCAICLLKARNFKLKTIKSKKSCLKKLGLIIEQKFSEQFKCICIESEHSIEIKESVAANIEQAFNEFLKGAEDGKTANERDQKINVKKNVKINEGKDETKGFLDSEVDAISELMHELLNACHTPAGTKF
jgi:hypothetical protein